MSEDILSVECAKKCEHLADYYSGLLQRRNWRPSRSDIEEMRDHLRRAARVIQTLKGNGK
jgi:hypothetical protein